MQLEHTPSRVAKLLGISASTLQTWEKHFQILGDEKHYSDAQIEQLRTIQVLIKERGFTVEGAKNELIRQQNWQEQKKQHLQELQKVKQFLVNMRDSM